MRHATAAGMRNAFGSEAAAHLRYLIFSEGADREKFPNVARLFRALAFVEKVHASSHYRQTSELLGEYCIGFVTPFIYARTVDNLARAWKAEREEGEELYGPLAAVARAQGEKHAAQNFGWMEQVKKCHSEMIRKTLDSLEHVAGDPEVGDLYVCDICGLIVEGEPPESCPVCKAKQFRFKRIE